MPAVYGMYPGYPDSDATLRAALLALPSVCVSGKIDDMFGITNGFYFHGSKESNDAYEKPWSIELIYPNGDEGFQVNAGVLGRADNVTAARKRGLRVEFKSIYGPSKLKFPGLFDGAKEGRETASDEFDALILRPGKAENYTAVSYNPTRNIYFRDIMVRDAQIAITGYGDRNIFVHLYLNGREIARSTGIPMRVQIFGPMGRLSDVGETLELQRPDTPQLDPDTGLTFAPNITVDELSYRSSAPWPTESAGTGTGISRINPLAFGDDPINWAAATPSYGASNIVDRMSEISSRTCLMSVTRKPPRRVW